MKTLIAALLIGLTLPVWADTPPPGTVKLKGASDGTSIGNVGDSLKVTGTFAPTGSTLVTQGAPAPAPSAWPVYLPSPIPNQHVTIDAMPSPLPISGSVTVLNQPSPVPTQTISGTVTANAGTNLNTSLLAIESGGHLASVDLKMPVLGQALAAGSVPVVLTAAQLATLTPLSTVTANIGTTNGLALNSSLTTINTTLGAPMQQTGGSVTANAGTNLNTSALALESGHLASIDTKLTSPLATSSTLQAGSAIVGKVGIDQTTPGTTNGVVVNSSALPTGAATSANQTTSNSSLATIVTNTTGISTAANQATANATLATLGLQSGVNTNLDHSGSGTIASALDTVAATTNGASACTFTTSGTFSAVLIFVGVTNGVSSPTASTPFSVSGAALSLFVSANTTVVIPVGGFGQMVAKAFSYTSGTANINWECGSGVGPAGFFGISTAAQASSTTIGSVSLGNSTGKVRVIQTGNLTSTATTANQAVLSYTVTTGKTLYLEEFDCGAVLNAAAATQTQFGTCQLAINGTVVWQQYYKGPGSGSFLPVVTYSEPIPVTAGQTVVLEVTPAAVTSFFWYANFGGYEK